ncbi:hypothetical protein DM860_014605 [Cuscuta australis]|uniref:Glutaredoxin domain-containing protein n=2 Tax=Cuscuta sect. Cleistogrammica TaxID=1824901 RepID=A0A328DH68_9ASTE|nr:hypothetical protein DM860_014605 [Cuscuta australis]
MMAGREKSESQNNNPKMNPVSPFNRSLTMAPGRTSGETFGLSRKPSVERIGSIKKIHGSSAFDSIVSVAGNSFTGKVKKLCSLFDAQKLSRGLSSFLPLQRQSSTVSAAAKPSISGSGDSPPLLPGTDDRVVVYFTSLRGIRRTFEDCYTARMILKSFRVNVDERDVSMDGAYRAELQSALGEKSVSLPQIFIKGKYIGGAEVIKQMNEVGELVKLLRGLPARPPGCAAVCNGCGDARFFPCTNCNGSKKVFDEGGGQVRRCHVCNEYGLVRCPFCCY